MAEAEPVRQNECPQCRYQPQDGNLWPQPHGAGRRPHRRKPRQRQEALKAGREIEECVV